MTRPRSVGWPHTLTMTRPGGPWPVMWPTGPLFEQRRVAARAAGRTKPVERCRRRSLRVTGHSAGAHHQQPPATNQPTNQPTNHAANKHAHLRHACMHACDAMRVDAMHVDAMRVDAHAPHTQCQCMAGAGGTCGSTSLPSWPYIYTSDHPTSPAAESMQFKGAQCYAATATASCIACLGHDGHAHEQPPLAGFMRTSRLPRGPTVGHHATQLARLMRPSLVLPSNPVVCKHNASVAAAATTKPTAVTQHDSASSGAGAPAHAR
eukprot:363931-Chlamydomonas_euryale.AAC.14